MNHTCRWMHTRKIKGQACDRKLRFWSQHGYSHNSAGMLFICRRLLRLLKKGEGTSTTSLPLPTSHTREIIQSSNASPPAETSTEHGSHRLLHNNTRKHTWASHNYDEGSRTVLTQNQMTSRHFVLMMALHSSANATQNEFAYWWFVKVGNRIGKAGIHCHLIPCFCLFI